MNNIKPIIKWAGGKSFLINDILERIKNLDLSNSTFYEPFCGGLSVSLGLEERFNKIVANDLNSNLILLYEEITKNLDSVVENIRLLEQKNTDTDYYEIRNEERLENFRDKSRPYKAARFIYLNKKGYNGLYRENSKGFYNVPFGKSVNKSFIDLDNLLKVSSVFKRKFEFRNQDFEESLKGVKKGDVVYFDPPYFPINKISFTKYTKNDFSTDDQSRLLKMMNTLSKKGVYVIVSNSVTDESSKMYKAWINSDKFVVKAPRLIASKIESRNKIDEYLIDNIGEINDNSRN